jgi:hypothetical protein
MTLLVQNAVFLVVFYLNISVRFKVIFLFMYIRGALWYRYPKLTKWRCLSRFTIIRAQRAMCGPISDLKDEIRWCDWTRNGHYQILIICIGSYCDTAMPYCNILQYDFCRWYSPLCITMTTPLCYHDIPLCYHDKLTPLCYHDNAIVLCSVRCVCALRPACVAYLIVCHLVFPLVNI